MNQSMIPAKPIPWIILSLGIPIWLISDLWSKAYFFKPEFNYDLLLARIYWDGTPYVFPAINKGSAWSIGANHQGFIALLTVFLIPLIIWFYWSSFRHLGRYFGIAFAGIIGGAFGNAYDRFAVFLFDQHWGGVRDFADVHLGFMGIDYRWPTFNVADVGIRCRVCYAPACHGDGLFSTKKAVSRNAAFV